MANDWAEGMKRARQFAFPENGPFVGPGQPEPDALVEVGWDQNKLMPAYRVNGELVPFTPLVQSAPEGSKDWYVEAFADAAIKTRWREADAVTRARIDAKSTHIAASTPVPGDRLPRRARPNRSAWRRRSPCGPATGFLWAGALVGVDRRRGSPHERRRDRGSA